MLKKGNIKIIADLQNLLSGFDHQRFAHQGTWRGGGECLYPTQAKKTAFSLLLPQVTKIINSFFLNLARKKQNECRMG